VFLLHSKGGHAHGRSEPLNDCSNEVHHQQQKVENAKPAPLAHRMVISFKMGSRPGAREMETTVDSNVERDLLFKRARKGVMREADSRLNHRLSALVRRI
jgi:hypothetical protein